MSERAPRYADGDARDWRVRLAAFSFLADQTARYGDVLPRAVLAKGFQFEGQIVKLVGPKGIFKPAILPELPLTITTIPAVEGRERPYDDRLDANDFLHYRYRGTDPNHYDNAALRKAMARAVPLIYFHGLVPGEYCPAWPVYVVGDDPVALVFRVAVDSVDHVLTSRPDGSMEAGEGRRRYITVETQRRLHQHSFRLRVLQAYRERCAVCHLRHAELLDAAHILPDSHPLGQPVVHNGLALCRLHHAAFDRNILGVRPDFVITIRRDILEEDDGPMLVHGLQQFSGARLELPRNASFHPDPERLAERYGLFRAGQG